MKMTTIQFAGKTLCSTKDYGKIKFLDFNRNPCEPHVQKLMESIKKWGFKGVAQVIKTSMVTGKTEYFILDGQHRLTASKRLGTDFDFELTVLETQEEALKFMADLNNSSKGWGTKQFLNSWALAGKGAYIKLQEVFNETGFQITPLLEIYTYSSNQTPFRKGTMTFPNEKESDKLIAQMVDLNAYLPKKAYCRRSIIKCLRLPNYNHKIMKGVISTLAEVQDFPEDEIKLKETLEKLINKNCKPKRMAA